MSDNRQGEVSARGVARQHDLRGRVGPEHVPERRDGLVTWPGYFNPGASAYSSKATFSANGTWPRAISGLPKPPPWR